MKSRQRRTKKLYAELFTNPKALFGDAELILWPNGERGEIWIRSTQAPYTSFRITAAEGPRGFALRVDAHPLSQFDVFSSEGHGINAYDHRHLEICAYKPDEDSQQFRAWYHGSAHHPECPFLKDASAKCNCNRPNLARNGGAL